MDLALVLKQTPQMKQILVCNISFSVKYIVQILMYVILLSNPSGSRYSSHNRAVFAAAEG